MIRGNKLLLNFPAGGTQQLVGPNSRRVGLIVSTPSIAAVLMSFGDSPDPVNGIRMNSGSYAPWNLIFDEPNDFITQPIWVSAQGATLYFAVELLDLPD